MIPANGLYDAHYNDDKGDTFTRTVIAWDTEGHALVVGPRTLVRADSWANFEGLYPAQQLPAVGAIPGGGWVSRYKHPDGSTTTSPVLGWLVRIDGTLSPLDTDSEGWAEHPGEAANFVRIEPPADES